MFSFVPSVQRLEMHKNFKTFPQAYEIIHSTVNDVSYRSVGKLRAHQQHCIFHYTIKGHGEVIYHGKPYLTSAGQGFFNIINEEDSGYGYPKNQTEPWEFVVICFDGGNTREITRELLDNKVVYDISKHSEVFLRMCKDLLNPSNLNGQITFLSKLLTLLFEETDNQNYLVANFREIVKRDVMLNPTIEAIADQLNVSREHLQREYRNQTGISPAKYLRDRRFEILCSLLMTDLTEKQIVKKMNFASVSGMSIFFKKITGITPRQYRLRGAYTV